MRESILNKLRELFRSGRYVTFLPRRAGLTSMRQARIMSDIMNYKYNSKIMISNGIPEREQRTIAQEEWRNLETQEERARILGASVTPMYQTDDFYSPSMLEMVNDVTTTTYTNADLSATASSVWSSGGGGYGSDLPYRTLRVHNILKMLEEEKKKSNFPEIIDRIIEKVRSM